MEYHKTEFLSITVVLVHANYSVLHIQYSLFQGLEQLQSKHKFVLDLYSVFLMIQFRLNYEHFHPITEITTNWAVAGPKHEFIGNGTNSQSCQNLNVPVFCSFAF